MAKLLDRCMQSEHRGSITGKWKEKVTCTTARFLLFPLTSDGTYFSRDEKGESGV